MGCDTGAASAGRSLCSAGSNACRGGVGRRPPSIALAAAADPAAQHQGGSPLCPERDSLRQSEGGTRKRGTIILSQPARSYDHCCHPPRARAAPHSPHTHAPPRDRERPKRFERDGKRASESRCKKTRLSEWDGMDASWCVLASVKAIAGRLR